MARAKANTLQRVPNVGTQAITKTPVRSETTFVIRLKSGKYSSTDEPLGEGVL